MPVDLRSDTVTRPTPAMRQAIFEAEVGDHIYGEDPTVNRLQDVVAGLLGKEKAVFVPSGIMANQLALLLHTRPGDEIILERKCHIFNHEGGATGFLSGVQTCPVEGDRGMISAETVSNVLRRGFYGEPTSRLLCLENTHNHAGGRVLPQHEVLETIAFARSNGLAVHLDGARLWNAAAATGLAPAELAAPFDTVSVCLSKGLGAPVGSLLAGPAELMTRAVRLRNSIGGGMRQAGILAAAGLHALAHHRDRLAEDHQRARKLARALATCPGFLIDPDTVDTNIVLFRVANDAVADILNTLRANDIWMAPFGPGIVRAVLHLDISDTDLDYTVNTVRRLFAS